MRFNFPASKVHDDGNNSGALAQRAAAAVLALSMMAAAPHAHARPTEPLPPAHYHNTTYAPPEAQIAVQQSKIRVRYIGVENCPSVVALGHGNSLPNIWTGALQAVAPSDNNDIEQLAGNISSSFSASVDKGEAGYAKDEYGPRL
jgi:curli biogenesis system outer membrane secretion channel CsgG